MATPTKYDLFDNPALNLQNGSGPDSLSATIDTYQNQNLSPSQVYALGNSLPQTVGGIPGLSIIPGLGKIPVPGVEDLNKALSPLNAARFSLNGDMTTLHYADDLNNHFPKFKFLFKVRFFGFPSNGSDHSAFYFFVHKCDKPKVRFNHTDVNYYNFRTRVLTSVTYEPLSMTFLDEIGDSVNEFFRMYLAQRSGTGVGNYGIDRGWGPSSSSRPYNNGYSEKFNQRIVVEQVFNMLQGGSSETRANRFIFINPRIETFDFDELSHEDSSNGSMATITFSYDSIITETVNDDTLYSWGQTDLLKGGGSSGEENAGHTDGAKMNTQKKPTQKITHNSPYDQLTKGVDAIRSIPSALGGIVNPILAGITNPIFGTTSVTSPSSDTVQGASIQGTLNSIKNGTNNPGRQNG